MPILEVTVSPDYVEWGIWEALRELLQNARDSHDLGYKMSWDYNAKTRVFSLDNVGARLGRETLVLGGTTKRDDASQRGQFGEGYKLALATLIKQGCKVTIDNQHEVWLPEISHSDVFNTSVLKIAIKKRVRSFDGLRFIVTNISQDQYNTLLERLLFLDLETNNVSEDVILKNESHVNKLFVKGIYISELSDPSKYGYNLSSVLMNRDRTLADPFSLSSNVVKAISKSVMSGDLSVEEAYDAIARPNEDGEWLFEASSFGKGYYYAPHSFIKKMIEYFEGKYGLSAVPVTQLSQLSEAGHYGKIGIITSVGFASLVSVLRPDLKSISVTQGIDSKKEYEFSKLETWERANLQKAVRCVQPFERLSGAGCDFPKELGTFQISIVDFKSPSISGLFCAEEDFTSIRISRKCLSDFPELIATLIHEVSHKYGKDGTVEHLRSIELISGRIINSLIT